MRGLFLAALTALAALLVPAAASAQTPHTSWVRYDLAGRVTGTITPDQPYAGSYLAVRNTYDAAGRLIRVEEGTLAAWQSEAVAPANWTGFGVFRMTQLQYDPMGRKTREELWAQAGSALVGVTQYSYDNLGRLTCTAVRMNPAVFGSLPASACTLGTTGSQGPDRITRNVYDAAGQRIQRRVGVGTADEGTEATWAYNANGQVTTVIDGNGNRAELRYDGLARQDRWTFPSTTRPGSFNDSTQATALASAGSVNAGDYEQYGYDANGNRTSLRRRDGTTLTYSYDALNRMSVKTVPERGAPLPPLGAWATRDVYYGYDLQGLQIFARFDSVTGEGIANGYDGFGRQLSSGITMGGVTRTLTYRYDRNGNRTRITHPDGQWFQQDYDELDRPSWLSWQGAGGLVYINRDADGQPANVNRDVGTMALFSYDNVRRVSGMQFSLGGAPNDVSWTYGRNPAGQITTLTRDNDAYAWTAHYAVTRPYTTNGLNQYTAAGSGGGAVSYSYDANGNLTGDGSRTFLYDVENRLVQVNAVSGGATIGYIIYDPLGRIFQYGAGGGARQFLYDGDALVAEYDPNAGGTMTARYVHGVGADVPYVWYVGAGLGDRRFLYGDHQGSIVAVVGSSVAINRYDEYGIPQGTLSGRFAYTGQIWLPEIGLYHYKARAYSPTLGRFLQTDPIGYEGGISLYAYVGDDPVNRVDPLGRFQIPESIRIGAAAGCAITAEIGCVEGAVLGGAGGLIVGLCLVYCPSLMADEPAPPPPERAPPRVPNRAPDGASVEPGAGPRGEPGFRGRPGTWQSGPRQDRKYGSDGYPETDIDDPSEGSRHGAPSPHAQDWGRPAGGGPPTGADRGAPRAPERGENFTQPYRNPDGYLPPSRLPRRYDPH